jgi:hypothetical protein
MARRIPVKQWPAQLEAVEATIKARWPWLVTTISADRNQLDIEAEELRVSGEVRLDSLPGRPGVMVVHCQMSGGGGIIGPLSEAEDAMFCCRAVLDALHHAQGMLARFHVYAFEIPCARCTGTGKVRESQPSKGKRKGESVSELKTCPFCAGTGTEPTDETSDA